MIIISADDGLTEQRNHCGPHQKLLNTFTPASTSYRHILDKNILIKPARSNKKYRTKMHRIW